jgi:hypothetical protein
MKMWEIAVRLLQAPFTPDAYEDMSAYLLGRDVLEEEPQLARQVEALDREFIRALATSQAPWPHEMDDMMSRMRMAEFAWWQRLRQAAAEERSGNLKQIAA